MMNAPMLTRGFASPLALADRALDDVFSAFFRPLSERGGSAEAIAPPVDVTDRGDHYAIESDLPGVDKENINVYVQGDDLVIEAETRGAQREEPDGGQAILRERRWGRWRWRRALRLGSDVDPDNISATYNNGVLEVRVPKSQEYVPQRKRIEIH